MDAALALISTEPKPEALRVSPRPEAKKIFDEAYLKIIEGLGVMGYPVTTDDNFTETAGRASRAMLEMVRPIAEIENEVDALLDKTFQAR